MVLRNRGVKTIVQCKRFSKPAGVAVVRELYGVLRDCEVDDALLACTGGFTQGVYDFVKGKPIKLLGLKEIIELQKSLAQDESALTKSLRATS